MVIRLAQSRQEGDVQLLKQALKDNIVFREMEYGKGCTEPLSLARSSLEFFVDTCDLPHLLSSLCTTNGL